MTTLGAVICTWMTERSYAGPKEAAMKDFQPPEEGKSEKLGSPSSETKAPWMPGRLPAHRAVTSGHEGSTR